MTCLHAKYISLWHCCIVIYQ